jgi:predicted transcriptional regulator
MRTTVRLDDDLLAAAKQRAAASHKTLSALVEDSLKQTLGLHQIQSRQWLAIKPFGAEGMLAGVHLDDSERLHDRMDGLP